jgi:tRNA A37 threonylcarbamoyladenosine dehydratase
MRILNPSATPSSIPVISPKEAGNKHHPKKIKVNKLLVAKMPHPGQ